MTLLERASRFAHQMVRIGARPPFYMETDRENAGRELDAFQRFTRKPLNPDGTVEPQKRISAELAEPGFHKVSIHTPDGCVVLALRDRAP